MSSSATTRVVTVSYVSGAASLANILQTTQTWTYELSGTAIAGDQQAASQPIQGSASWASRARVFPNPICGHALPGLLILWIFLAFIEGVAQAT